MNAIYKNGIPFFPDVGGLQFEDAQDVSLISSCLLFLGSTKGGKSLVSQSLGLKLFR